MAKKVKISQVEGLETSLTQEGVLLYLTCNEGNGEKLFDSVSENFATLHNNVQFVDGVSGSGVLVKTSGKILLNTPIGGEELTLSVWHKVSDEAGVSTSWRCIFGAEGSNLHPMIFQNKRTIGFWDGNFKNSGALVPDDGRYHHIAITYSATIAKIYLDGKFISSHSHNFNFLNNKINSLGDHASYSYPSGYNDEFRIYGRCLTHDEISYLFRSTLFIGVLNIKQIKGVEVFALANQLSNYIPINGATTVNGTKTFTEAPIVPAGTLNGHAVNLAQLQALVRTWHEVLNAGSGSDAVVNRGVTITNTSTTNNQDIFSVFHYPNESYDRFFRIQNVAGRLSFYTSQNQENGTGVDIAFFGYYALHALKRDVLNTAIAFNSAFGTNAFRELETGVGNSAFGNNAGRYVKEGDNNTFFGRSAGYSLNLNRLTGSNNTFLGARAGYGVGSTSSGNTIIGVDPTVSTEIHNEVIICYGVGQVAFRKHSDGRVVLPTQTKETYAADTTGKAVVTKEILNSYIDVTLDHSALVEMAANELTVTQASFGINTSTHFVRIVPYKCEGTFISPEENATLRSVYLMKDNNKIVGWNWMNSEKWNSRRVSNDFGAAQISGENPSGYEVTGNFKIGCHSYIGGDSATTFKMRIYYEIAEL